MSSDLTVVIAWPIPVQTLLREAPIVLRDLLRVEAVPPLLIEEMIEGRRQPMRADTIGAENALLLMSLQDEEETVFMTVVDHYVEIPGFPYPGLDHGKFADVDVSFSRTPLEFAMAAAVAIVLARESKTPITDEALCWTRTYQQNPDAFADAIRVQDNFPDMRAAAQTLYAVRHNEKVVYTSNKHITSHPVAS